MKEKIYLGGSCGKERRELMEKIAEYIRQHYGGYDLYCPFELKVDEKINGKWQLEKEEWAEKVFLADIQAIDECGIFLMISEGRESTAGVNWEQGYAYAKGKYIGVIQITDKSTSLMTYGGRNDFYNTDGTLTDILSKIDRIIANKCLAEVKKDHNLKSYKKISDTKCTTILT